jgi:hypothetical protein
MGAQAPASVASIQLEPGWRAESLSNRQIAKVLDVHKFMTQLSCVILVLQMRHQMLQMQHPNPSLRRMAG